MMKIDQSALAPSGEVRAAEDVAEDDEQQPDPDEEQGEPHHRPEELTGAELGEDHVYLHGIEEEHHSCRVHEATEKQLADLGEHEVGRDHDQADAPLVAVEVDGVEDALKERRCRDQQREAPARVSIKHVEASVGDGAAAEDAAIRIAPLERRRDVEQRHGDQAHRGRDRQPVTILRPRHDDEGADGDEETGEAQPGAEGTARSPALRVIEDVGS